MTTTPTAVTASQPTCRLPMPTDLCRWPEVAIEQLDETTYLRRVGPTEQLPYSEAAGDGQLEPEFYLWELPDVDLSNPDAIAHFVSEFGPLTCQTMGRKFMGAETGFRMLRNLIVEKTDAGKEGVLPLDEFRFAARTLRDITRALLANAGVLDADKMVKAWETKRPFQGSGEEARAQALTWAVDALNAGLTPFGPRLVLRGATGGVGAGTEPCTELYNAICLEIFNDVAAGSTFRRCDKCGRVFVRQRGRAVYGQHKREAQLRYCSKRCANAAAQAAHRKKLAEAKGRTD
jgi:hypothetical protein